MTEQPPDLDQNGHPVGAAPPDLDASGKPAAPSAADSWRLHPINAQEGPTPAPDWKANLAGALEPMAHPKTAGDIAGLLIPGEAGATVMSKMVEPVVAGVKKYGSAAAKVAGAAATTMLPPSMVTPARAALKVLGELKPTEWNSPLTVAGREGRAHAAVAGQVDRFMPNTGGMPTSATVTPSGGRVPYAMPAATETAAPAAASGMTDAEKALLVKKYPGLDPAKVEQQMGGRPPITVSPDSQMQPPPDSPLLQPRVDIGAEKVGRINGLSKIDVRNQTGPIRGEAPGEAAGMPAKPRERILDKLIDMGPKGRGLPEAEREAYAAAGTSDKARLQVQAYLDALRKVGFVGAGAAAPALMRNKLVSGIEEQ